MAIKRSRYKGEIVTIQRRDAECPGNIIIEFRDGRRQSVPESNISYHKGPRVRPLETLEKRGICGL